MNLADQLNQLADDVDTRLLPDAHEIRRTGERIRRHRRTRLSVGATALAAVAIVATMAILTLAGPPPTPVPAGPIDGWRVTRTVHVPGTGAILYGDDSLWVVDMQDGALTPDGATPTGSLYQIDPTSGEVLDRIPGAVGGWPTIAGGAIWLCTAAGDLDVLTRVDLATHRVSQVPTSRPKQLPHGTALAGGNLWVANSVTGDLVRMDPQTERVRQTIHVGKGGSAQVPGQPISDGHSLWMTNDDGLVTRFDGATGETTSQLQLPARDVSLVGIDSGRHLLYAASRDSVFEINVDPARPDQLGRQVVVTPQRVDVMIAGFIPGPGSLWVATLNPDELVRIDPNTFTVTGRMPLTGMDHGSNVPVAVAASSRSVWIRLEGKILELAPQR